MMQFGLDVDTLGNLKPIAKVVFSLGSNQGDSEVVLQQAVDALADTPDVIIVDISPVYRTKPVGLVADQPDFLNLVVVAESTLEPMTLLDRANAIEDAFGRVREVAGGPRTLDIDIIMVGRRTSEEAIELPHPRAHERAFVLVPWLDADPLAELAGHGAVKDLVAQMDLSGVTRTDIVITKS
ncbi:MAG: 2-amino-4-hydroxy-6-hydroxymethyldihydropteridine diphosphokinase [Propionibacteriaceae bacterium]|nr:2-amino-4-hydroxy-6-hydroxymethyldihydropteridine diphosphokinase [Propionibacteriaceae bacterium]